MSEPNGSMLPALQAYGQGSTGAMPSADDLATYSRLLSQQPMQGVNIHTQAADAPRSPAWIAEQTIEPVAFGSLADPVSQFAFLGAPGLLRGAKGLLETAGSPGPRVGGWMSGERGNLGPVPRSQAGAPLPESAVRDQAGNLQRLYHGTNRVYPDFEVSQYSSGAGGDLYGPGIYMTANPDVAASYAARDWSRFGRDQLQGMAESQALKEQALAQAATARTPSEAQWALGAAQQHDARVQAAGRMLGRYGSEQPGWFPSPANVRPVYADLKQPFDMDGRLAREAVERVEREAGMVPAAKSPTYVSASAREVYEDVVGAMGSKAGANEVLRRAGYDGITHLGGQGPGGQPHRVYIAFHPDSVYPAANVEGGR